MAKRSRSHNWLVLILMLFAETHAGTSFRTDEEKMPNKTSRIAEQFAKTKTICVGRFLIDVPHDSEVIFGPAYMNAELEVVKLGAAQLASLIEEEQAQVAANAYLAEGPLKEEGSMLGKVVDGEVPGQRILYGLGGGGIFYRISSFTPLGEDVLIATLSAYPQAHRYHEVVAHLTSIARNARQRREGEAPDAEGLCIDGAFVHQMAAFVTERVTLGVRLKHFSDVHFSMETTAKNERVESDALEPRLVGAEKEAKARGGGDWYSKIKFFRRGKTSIGKWAGFEVLAKKPKQGTLFAAHEFAFVGLGMPQDPYLPVLDLVMHTGVIENSPATVRPSLTDDEALQLWERLTSSIRVRPVRKHINGSGRSSTDR